MSQQVRVGRAGPCKVCGRLITLTFLDEHDRATVSHEPPVCAEFLAHMGRPPDRVATRATVIPLTVKKAGEA